MEMEKGIHVDVLSSSPITQPLTLNRPKLGLRSDQEILSSVRGPGCQNVEQRDDCREKIRKIQSKNDARYPEEVSNEWSWIDTPNGVAKNERDA